MRNPRYASAADDRAPDSGFAAVYAGNLSVDRAGVRVLHRVSLSIARGECVTITGPNGAGKTTLLAAILGLIPRADGKLEVSGLEVGSRAWRRRRRMVGYVSQHAVQTDFPVSVREVVAIGLSGSRLSRSAARARMDEAMRRTGCAGLASRPYGELSGGQRQRVSIARCLCQAPRTLLLDEPTASLDPEGKETLRELAEQLSSESGITVVMVSHESEYFDRPGWRRIELTGGRVSGSGEA
ncbi:MAG: metal ABC transporter ATP-binding protein [Spirochaetales bacterium]